MACYSPLRAFKGRWEGGKQSIVWKRSDSPSSLELNLPCGQCFGCRLERSRQWAVRCMHESAGWKRNCFITLTYGDAYIPFGGSLVLSHFQKFMKRLRKRYGSGIRFFHCGEYGSKFERPHYHAIIFNHDFDDRVLFSNDNDVKLYTSLQLSELWPLGFSTVGDVTFESAAYVARYVMKKVTGEMASDHYGGRRPEYVTMSRRPGIAKFWFDKWRSDVYPSDEVIVRGKSCKPPRFYDNQLSEDELWRVKAVRKGHAPRLEIVDVDGKRMLVSEADEVRLRVKEDVKKAQCAALKRKLEA